MNKVGCEIRIVGSLEGFERKLHADIKRGSTVTPIGGLVMTPQTFSKVFSPERILLMQLLHKKDFGSIYRLAKELKKPYEVVFRNVKYLEGIGLVKLIEKDNRKSPRLSCDFTINLFKDPVEA